MSSTHDPTGAMDEADLEALRETVRSVCARSWSAATAAPVADLGEIWDAAVIQGWTELCGLELAPAALAVQEELGGVACPLPIVDLAVISTIAGSIGQASTVAAISSGEVRAAVGRGPSRAVR